jgi:hypothetical protein
MTSKDIMYSKGKNDECYTPSYTVKPIIKYIEQYYQTSKNSKLTVWCPFDTKDSEFVKQISKLSYIDVVHSHINEGKDFFKYEPKHWDIIISNPPFCFDENTEILTKNGWVNIKNITKKHEPMTVNPINLKLKYSKIKNITKQYYIGEMFEIKSKYLDFKITPNHRMVCYDNQNNLVLNKKTNDLPYIKDIMKHSNKYIPLVGYKIEDYKDIKEIVIPEMSFKVGKAHGKKSIKKYPEIKIKIEKWLSFFGLWLADGYVSGSNGGRNKYSVGIKQHTKNHEIVSRILNNLGLRWKYNINKNNTVNYEIYSMQFNKYMSVFGNSYNKFIPRYILNLPKEKLNILLKWYLFGDCGNLKNNGGYISTVSKQLADDLTELSIKTGKILSMKLKKKKYKNKDYFIYEGTLIRDNSVNKKAKLKNNYCKKEIFNGYVYGIEVEENKTLVVRRNGTVMITGNSNKRKTFERALSFNKPFALLMNITWLNDKAPKEIFGNDMQLLLLDNRSLFIFPDGTTNDKITFSSAYFGYKFFQQGIQVEHIPSISEQKKILNQNRKDSL